MKVSILPLEWQNLGDIVTPENGCLKLCIYPKCVFLITVTSERETESIGGQENLCENKKAVFQERKLIRELRYLFPILIKNEKKLREEMKKKEERVLRVTKDFLRTRL